MNKKGFTLLEVMLAVAIMAIASTMIMVGFLTTMTYSRNTTLYARVGSANYDNCITRLSDMTSNPQSRYLLNPELHALGTSTVTLGSSNVSTVPFEIHWGGQANSIVRSAKVTTDVNNVVNDAGGAYNVSEVSLPDGSGETVAEMTQTGGAHQHSYSGDSTYSDNRTTFFYYTPVTCPICQTAGDVGQIEYGSVSGVVGFYCKNTHDAGVVAAAGGTITPQGYVRVAEYSGTTIVPTI